MLVDKDHAPVRVLIVSVTARDSASATGQLIQTLFETLEPIETLSLYAGYPSVNQQYRQVLFKRNRLFSAYQAIKEFNPDVVYVRPSLKPLSFNFFALFVILTLSSRIVLHIMDDESNDTTNGGFLSRFSFSLYLRWLIHRSDKIFTISPGMSAAFFERYGCDSQPLSNILRPGLPVGKRIFKQNEKIKIGYFGSLDIRMNLRCVEETCATLDKLNSIGYSISLDVFTRPMYLEWANSNLCFENTSFHSYVPSEKYFEILRTYDVLLIAYNFDPVSIEYCRFSIANKLADYLGAGVPILVVGPDAIETVAHCKQNEIGTTISSGYSMLERDISRYLERLQAGGASQSGMWERHNRALGLKSAMDAWHSAFRAVD
ncbi:MAG: hypothetical protein NXH95_10765 [Pseudomonadaceae bacterium]|nr:hypothetical protein [Pseudomonadaceae bacterium]